MSTEFRTRDSRFMSSQNSKPKRRWTYVVIALATIGVVTFSVFAAIPKQTPTTSIASSTLIGKQAPDIIGMTQNSSRYNLGKLKGNYVFVNFFASWCVPCRTETAAIESFLAKAPKTIFANHVSIVGVTVNDRSASAAQFVRANSISWPVIFDGSGVIGLSWGVGSPPQTFLVAPNGNVITRIVGPVTEGGMMSLMNLAYSTYGP